MVLKDGSRESPTKNGKESKKDQKSCEGGHFFVEETFMDELPCYWLLVSSHNLHLHLTDLG